MKQTRPPLVRIQYIDQQLREQSWPNCTRLARYFEISTKSIQRDIEYMRDQLHAPIEFNSKKNGFYYSTKDWTFLPSTILDRQEADSLVITKKVLSQYQGTPYYEEVNRALDKVMQYLPGTLTATPLADIYSFESFSPSIIDASFFALLEEAIRSKRTIILTYQAFWNSQITERTVHPYRLHFSHTKENWSLFGYCELRQEIRSFIVSRIKNVTITKEEFTVHDSFCFERYLEESFDQIHVDEVQEVAIRFTPYQAQWIREYRWHSTQQIEELENGFLVLKMQLGALDAVMHWVLRFGREAEVLEPLTLREMIRAELRCTQKVYEEPCVY